MLPLFMKSLSSFPYAEGWKMFTYLVNQISPLTVGELLLVYDSSKMDTIYVALAILAVWQQQNCATQLSEDQKTVRQQILTKFYAVLYILL